MFPTGSGNTSPTPNDPRKPSRNSLALDGLSPSPPSPRRRRRRRRDAGRVHPRERPHVRERVRVHPDVGQFAPRRRRLHGGERLREEIPAERVAARHPRRRRRRRILRRPSDVRRADAAGLEPSQRPDAAEEEPVRDARPSLVLARGGAERHERAELPAEMPRHALRQSLERLDLRLLLEETRRVSVEPDPRELASQAPQRARRGADRSVARVAADGVRQRRLQRVPELISHRPRREPRRVRDLSQDERVFQSRGAAAQDLHGDPAVGLVERGEPGRGKRGGKRERRAKRKSVLKKRRATRIRGRMGSSLTSSRR